LLIVPPFQNWIALLLAAVLPLQVVLPRSSTVRPPNTTFVLAPEIVRSFANVVVPTPAIEPPVHRAGAVKACASPLRLLPLRISGAVCVPPLIVTTASAPTLSVLIASVPRPCVVTPFSTLLPFLKSSTAPAAMLNVPVLVPPDGSSVPALTLTTPELLKATPMSIVVAVFDCLL
jgi:hypothetical protein